MKGIAARDRVISDANVHVLYKEEARTFVRAEVFPPDWPQKLERLKAGRYEPSPCLAVLADQSVHLWREDDDLVAAVTWRGQLLCWETMHWVTDGSQIGSWLRCFLTQLRGEAGAGGEFPIRSWNSQISLPEGFAYERTLSEMDLAQGPLVCLPLDRSTWLPPTRRQAQEAGRRRRSAVLVLAGVGSLILAAIAIAGFTHWNVARQIRTLDTQIARLEIEAAPIRDAAERWRRVEPAVDQRFFPIEILHHIVAAIPESVRLTIFETTPESVLIEGEAKNVSAATEFLARIQNIEELRSLSWEMPPPSLQANNTARFVIIGARVDAEQ